KSINLLGGGPGSGKTIFGMQYLVNGTREFNENGVYITFEQDQDEIERLFDEMGWDLEELEKQKKVIILRIDPEQIHKLLEAGGGTLRDSIEGINAKRVVIDSISDFLLLYKTDLDKRTAVTDLFNLLAKMKVTSLIISEQETDPLKHVTSIIEYQVDGVILLYNERIGHVRQRALEIFKMRGTKHAGRILPMVISNNGVSIRVGS
ncbi:MAG: RAD55 family ATPase, partial [Candidatus Woesearchaeota archaeon]